MNNTDNSEVKQVFSREEAIAVINELYENDISPLYVIGDNTVSDVKDPDTFLYKKSISIFGHQFHTRLGVVYFNMRDRCRIGGAKQRNQPHYIGTTMCEEWLDFDSWAYWASTQIGLNQRDESGRLFVLDKDLLGNGSKHYSPNTTTFLPQEINQAITSKGCKGYSEVGDKFVAQISIGGKAKNLGTYDTIKQAKVAYRKAKRRELRRLANKYKHQISVVAYEVLLKFKV